jgi:hypothetical protein
VTFLPADDGTNDVDDLRFLFCLFLSCVMGFLVAVRIEDWETGRVIALASA